MENRGLTVVFIAIVASLQSNFVRSQSPGGTSPTGCNFHDAYFNTTTNECDCVKGFVMSRLARKCLPVATGIESFCEEDQQCQKSLGICTACQLVRTLRGPSVKKCLCGSGYYWSEKDSSCVRNEGDDSSELVGSCQMPIYCASPNAYYNTTTKRCDCSDGYVIASDHRKCLPVAAALGADCVEDQQCTKSLGVCTSCATIGRVKNVKRYQVGKCVCGSGYYWSARDNACLISKFSRGKIDEHAVQSCPLPITCTFSNGYYNETTKQCDCVNGYTLADDRHECLPVANELGDQCKEHQQCHQNLGVCTSCETVLGRDGKQCVCAAGYEWVEKNNSCQRPKGDDSSGLVQSCHMPINCKLPNGYYNSATEECACLEGYVMARARRECLPVATALGSPCMEDRQCHEKLGHSTACELNIKQTPTRVFLERKCVCAVGYYLKDDTCRKLRVFRNIEMNKCQNDEECSTIISGTECDEETSSCRCDSTTAPNEDHSECLPTEASNEDFLDPGRR